MKPSSSSIQDRPALRAFRALGLFSHFVITPAIFFPAFLLFAIAETTQARLVASALLLLWTATLCLWLFHFCRKRSVAVLATALLTVPGMTSWMFAYILSPSGSMPGSSFTSHYDGKARFQRGSITNLVPEIDQLKVGTYLAESMDPSLASSGSARLRNLVMNIYREMQTDPAFREVGSSLGFCYEDILLDSREVLHFYRYDPVRQKPQASVLIFMHGSLGNFKGYSWVLKKFADETGTVVIAPTYGAGNWAYDPKTRVLESVLAYCRTQPSLDMSRVYLGGISNGGTGVTRAIAHGGTEWAGVLLISPVIEDSVIGKTTFIDQARGIPFLMVHGEVDDRIPVGLVRESVKTLRNNGAVVTEHYFPDEDHFLFFSKPETVVTQMIDWIRTTETQASPP